MTCRHVISPALHLAAVDFLAPKEVVSLAASGLATAGDLLDWLPRRYEDRRRFDAFPAQAGGPAVCLRGTVVDSMKRRFGVRRQFYEAVATRDHVLTIQTADQQRFANLLLTIGVRME